MSPLTGNVLLAVSCLLLMMQTDGQSTGPIVTTKYGQVAGGKRIFLEKQYEEYLGIPFALPPIDSLRWTKPQPPEPWDGVRDATKYSRHCSHFLAILYQGIGMGGRYSEDCLYLNVWVPNGVEANQGKSLPVMVFIYGGGYAIGTGEMYPGYQLALHGDMVVVNFNYRVNVFGFLSTGDSAAPGNYGMWDVEAALVWVQENIAAFSGDPNRVTIFGQSAGGSQVSHSVISPKLRGLFGSAIAISGGATFSFGLDNNAARSTDVLARVLNCSGIGVTSQKKVDCLRAVDRDKLMFWSEVSQLAAFGTIKYAPVVDGDLIPLDPSEAFELGYGRNVNFMTGCTHHDEAAFVIVNPLAAPGLSDKLSWAATNESMYSTLTRFLGGAVNADELIGEMFERYPGMNTDDVDIRTEAVTRAMTDWQYTSRSMWEAGAQASFLVGYPSWVNGSHMDDLYGILGEPYMKIWRKLFLRHDFNDFDRQISRTMMNYYTNFAYTGNPNQGPYSVPVEWIQYDPARYNYLHQAPTFSNQEFDSQTLENFQFWHDLPNRAEYPSKADRKSTLYESDDVKFAGTTRESQPIENLNYQLTDQAIECGVQMYRDRMKQLFAGNEEMLRVMDELVNKLVAERYN